MTERQIFSNNAISLLQVSISSTSTNIQVQPGLGSLYPQPQHNEFFLITLEDIAAPLNREIIKIVSVVGDTLIIATDGRGWEDTDARDWVANETLVDHRITAGTIASAFHHPESVDTNVDIFEEGNLIGNVNKINFVGDGVSASLVGNTVNVSIPGASGSGGATLYPPTLIEPAWTNPIAQTSYSEMRRSNKFWVTLTAPVNGASECFEVLSIIQGLLATDTETVTWTISNRIGHKFLGQLVLRLDRPANQLILEWSNSEPTISVIATAVGL